jgi:hypothetical protein
MTTDEHLQMGMAAVAEALQKARIELEAYREDAERYRWFRDQCCTERKLDIIEAMDNVPYQFDHHIDKGRCGL